MAVLIKMADQKKIKSIHGCIDLHTVSLMHQSTPSSWNRLKTGNTSLRIGNYNFEPPSADYLCCCGQQTIVLLYCPVILRQEYCNYHFTTLLAPEVLQSSRKTLMHRSGEMENNIWHLMWKNSISQSLINNDYHHDPEKFGAFWICFQEL